jgi:hypothetical protein
MKVLFDPVIIAITIFGVDLLYNFLPMIVQTTLNPKEKSNILNFLHACTISMMIGYKMTNDIKSEHNDIYYDITIGYFLFDLCKQNGMSIFVAHHIISIYAIIYFRINDKTADLAREIYFYSEVGNIALYLTQLIKTIYTTDVDEHRDIASIGKSKKLMLSDSTLIKIYVVEWCWYVYFRMIVLQDILQHSTNETLDRLGTTLFVATTIWSLKLLRIIICLAVVMKWPPRSQACTPKHVATD